MFLGTFYAWFSALSRLTDSEKERFRIVRKKCTRTRQSSSCQHTHSTRRTACCQRSSPRLCRVRDPPQWGIFGRYSKPCRNVDRVFWYGPARYRTLYVPNTPQWFGRIFAASRPFLYECKYPGLAGIPRRAQPWKFHSDGCFTNTRAWRPTDAGKPKRFPFTTERYKYRNKHSTKHTPLRYQM